MQGSQIDLFDHWWAFWSSQDLADAPGSSEYRNVRLLWIMAQCPGPEHFIPTYANWVPDEMPRESVN